MEASLQHFHLAIEGRLSNFSSVFQTQIAHQIALALTSHYSLAEDPRAPYLVNKVEELFCLWSQRSTTGDIRPAGSNAPGPHGGFRTAFDLDLNRKLGEVERCLHQVCVYLRASTNGVPADASPLMDKMFLHLTSLKADSVHKATEINSPKKTDQQASAISALQIKLEQIELVFLNQSSVDLDALKDYINTICQ